MARPGEPVHELSPAPVVSISRGQNQRSFANLYSNQLNTLQKKVDPTEASAVLSCEEEVSIMPEKQTLERAREDAREGKSPSTQAGEFVREEMHHIREGKHGAASPKQAIAIGLSKARRSGVKLAPPTGGKTSARTRQKATRDYEKGQGHSRRKTTSRRSRATTEALKKQGRSAASHRSLSMQALSAARERGSASRRTAALKSSRSRW
jgi:hypothetical protein